MLTCIVLTVFLQIMRVRSFLYLISAFIATNVIFFGLRNWRQINHEISDRLVERKKHVESACFHNDKIPTNRFNWSVLFNNQKRRTFEGWQWFNNIHVCDKLGLIYCQ